MCNLVYRRNWGCPHFSEWGVSLRQILCTLTSCAAQFCDKRLIRRSVSATAISIYRLELLMNAKFTEKCEYPTATFDTRCQIA